MTDKVTKMQAADRMAFTLWPHNWANLFECLHSGLSRIESSGAFWASVQALESQYDAATGESHGWIGRPTPHALVNDDLVGAIAALESILDDINEGTQVDVEAVRLAIEDRILKRLQRAAGTLNPAGHYRDFDRNKQE